MRLIDADSLIVNMDKGMQGTDREYLKFYQMAVNDESTAYDVEKVIEQLDGEIFLTTNDDGETDDLSIKVMGADEVMKIVKSGVKEQPDHKHKERRENNGTNEQ